MSPDPRVMDPPLPPDLQDLEEQLLAVDRYTEEHIVPLTDRQLVWQPAPGRWSVAECLDHLNVVGYTILPRMGKVIDRAREAGKLRRGSWKPGWLGRGFVRFIEPPYKRRIPAPKVFTPPPTQNPRDIVRRFVELQPELIALLYRADDIDLGKVKVHSPVTKLLKLPLGDYLQFLIAHERRHLWQAEQVWKSEGFPAE